MIQNLIFGVYLLNSDFLVESLKASRNQQERSLILQYSFAQNSSLTLRNSVHSALSKYTPATQPKTLLYKFFNEHVFDWFQKKHLHDTSSRRPRIAFSKHLEDRCLYIPVNVHKKNLFQRCKKLLSGGGLNKFFEAVHWLGLVKLINFFNFDRNFWKFSSISVLP